MCRHRSIHDNLFCISHFLQLEAASATDSRFSPYAGKKLIGYLTHWHFKSDRKHCLLEVGGMDELEFSGGNWTIQLVR